MVYLCVAALTQGHKVALPVVASFRDRDDVMHLLDGGQPSLLETLLAERMLRGVPVAYAFPRSAVLSVGIGKAFVSVILLPRERPVLFTVLSLRKVPATGICTRSFRLPWHTDLTFMAYKKPVLSCARNFIRILLR